MRFACALSRAADGRDALRELESGAAGSLGAAPDLAILFFTAPLLDEAAAIAAGLRAALAPRVFLGVSCESVIGGDLEIEREPGAALLVGSLPGARLQPFHVGAAEWGALLANDEALQQRVGTGEEHQAQLLLGDPFTTPVDALLPRLDTLLGRPTFGGMASGGQRPGANLLFLNERACRDGAVGVGIGGAARVDMVVSQGCRPVGEPMVVTRCEGNRILELGRRPALPYAQEMLNALPDEEKRLIQTGSLFVGVVINEYQESFRRGDFLVRHLAGGDPETGALVVGEMLRPGQTVQFHVRDAASASEDLRELLRDQAGRVRPAGALLFSCNGRGTRMFAAPHHDASAALAAMPGVPLAGFFAMGELGPVGGRSFIHGHTASLALFRPAD